MIATCRLLAVAALTLMAAPALALEQVTLQLKWKHQFQFAGYYAAIERGYYRDAGLSVSIREAEHDVDPVGEVLGGRAEFAIGASELLLARAQGKPVVALAAILQHSPLVLLARQDTDTVQQLLDRRVMLLAHEAELFAYLRREGVPRERIREVDHSFDVGDLIAGRVDAMSAYSTDETFALRQARFPHSIMSPRSSGIDFYGDTLFTSASLLKNRRDMVEAFRGASLRGWQYAMSHPAEIAELILTNYSRRHSRPHLLFEAAEMQRLMQPDLIEIGQMSIGRWQHIGDTYVELGLLSGPVSLDDFIYSPTPRARVPAWLFPALAGAVLMLAAVAAMALRYRRLNQRLGAEVTERQRALQQLGLAQRDTLALIDATPGAAMLLNLDGVILNMNSSGAARFGMERDAIVGRNLFDMVPDDIRQRRRQVLGEAVSRRETRVMEDSRAGMYLRNTIVPVVESDSSVRHVAVFSEDITDRHNAELAMQESNRQLRLQIEEISKLQAKVAELAIHDGLTGLFNRRYLDETLEREVSRARREGSPLSLVMVDLDHFKSINDTYGHQAGDQVLKAIGELLRHGVRSEDVPCRYGGEEFLVLCPKMPVATAAARAEEWRQRIANIEVGFGNFALRFTASFGIAGYPGHGKTADDLAKAADLALYRAKREGRNQVVVY